MFSNLTMIDLWLLIMISLVVILMVFFYLMDQMDHPIIKLCSFGVLALSLSGLVLALAGVA